MEGGTERVLLMSIKMEDEIKDEGRRRKNDVTLMLETDSFGAWVTTAAAAAASQEGHSLHYRLDSSALDE